MIGDHPLLTLARHLAVRARVQELTTPKVLIVQAADDLYNNHNHISIVFHGLVKRVRLDFMVFIVDSIAS